MGGRCSIACPMGIDIAELVRDARHGGYKAGLLPGRRRGSPATPPADLPDIRAEAAEARGVPIPCDLPRAEVPSTAAPGHPPFGLVGHYPSRE